MSSSRKIDAIAWDQWIDTERNYRYYSGLADRYRKRATLITITILVTGIGAGSALVSSWPMWISTILSFSVTITAVAFAVSGWARIAAEADSVSTQYRWLANEWRRVWWHRNEPNIEVKIAVLDACTLAVCEVKINEDRALNRECHAEALCIVKAEHAHAE